MSGRQPLPYGIMEGLSVIHLESAQKRNVFAFHFYASLKDHDDLLHASASTGRNIKTGPTPPLGSFWS